MGVRDNELIRLKKYAEGLGVQVLFSQKKSEDNLGEWQIDGEKIIIYEKVHRSKTDMVLSLIHEIGHQVAHIKLNDRVLDEKLDEAIDSDETKRHRKKVLDWEIKGTEWWEEIYQNTDCRFPIWKLHAQKEVDLYLYEAYYETGKFPTRQKVREKRKEVKKKYKDRV